MTSLFLEFIFSSTTAERSRRWLSVHDFMRNNRTEPGKHAVCVTFLSDILKAAWLRAFPFIPSVARNLVDSGITAFSIVSFITAGFGYESQQ